MIARILKTGVNILVVLEEQYSFANTAAYRRILRRIITGIKKGSSLEDIFNDPVSGLSSMDRNLIRAAESSGQSAMVFEELGEYYTRLSMMMRKVTNSLFAPAIIFLAASFIAATPALFRSGFGSFIFEALVYIIGLGLVIGGSYFVLNNIKRKAANDPAAGRMWYAVPLWGDIARNLDLYRFLKVFSICISSGLGTAQSLNLAANVTDTFLMREDIYRARYLIEKKGMSITQAFTATNYLGDLVKKIMSTGELSGTLDSSVMKYAEYIYEDLGYQVKNFINLVKIGSYIFAALFVLSRIAVLYSEVFKQLKF